MGVSRNRSFSVKIDVIDRKVVGLCIGWSVGDAPEWARGEDGGLMDGGIEPPWLELREDGGISEVFVIDVCNETAGTYAW